MQTPTRGMKRAAIVGIIVFGAAACGSTTSPGSASPAATTTIHLAVSGPMTGDAAADGLHMRQGAELAVAQINGAGGIASGRYQGARLTIDYLDDRETVDGSVANANRVIADSSYWAFLGTGFSDAAIATAPVLDRAGVSFLSTYASSDAIVAKPRPNVFVVPPTFPAYAYSAAERAVKLGYRRIAILQANAGFATHMADLFAQHLTSLGGTVVDTETYELGAKDVQTAIAKVAAAHPDAVALAGLTGDDVAQIKALHAAGVTAPVIDTEAVLFSQDFLSSAGADAAGAIGQTPTDPQRNTAAAQALRNAYRARYGTDVIPDPASFTYEAVVAVATALQSSPADRTQLAGALHGLSIADTGVGSLSFASDGTRLNGYLWYFTVRGGRFDFQTGYRQTAPRTVEEVPLQR